METAVTDLSSLTLVPLNDSELDSINRYVVLNELCENGPKIEDTIRRNDLQETLSFLSRQLCALQITKPRVGIEGLIVGNIGFNKKTLDVKELFSTELDQLSIKSLEKIQKVDLVLGKAGIEWQSEGYNLQSLFNNSRDIYHDFLLAGFGSPDVMDKGKHTFTDTLGITPENFLIFYDKLITEVPELKSVLEQIRSKLCRVDKDKNEKWYKTLNWNGEELDLLDEMESSGEDVKREAIGNIILKFQKDKEHSSLSVPEGGIQIGKYHLSSVDENGILKLHPNGEIYAYADLEIPERSERFKRELFALSTKNTRELADFYIKSWESQLRKLKRDEDYQGSAEWLGRQIRYLKHEKEVPLDLKEILNSKQTTLLSGTKILSDHFEFEGCRGTTYFGIDLAETYHHLQNYFARMPYVFDERALWTSNGKPINSGEAYLERINGNKRQINSKITNKKLLEERI